MFAEVLDTPLWFYIPSESNLADILSMTALPFQLPDRGMCIIGQQLSLILIYHFRIIKLIVIYKMKPMY